SSDGGWSTGVAIADINGDGLKDIYVSRFLLEDEALRKNLLYINKGEMRFEESASDFGLDDSGYSIQAAFIDYDRDGDLDLYCVNQPPNHSSRRMQLKGKIDYSFTDRLYRNDGEQFTEVTEEAGITNYAYGLSAVVSDINADGWPDIYVSCDFDEPDLLYINQQDGRFKNEADAQLQHMSNFSMGADIADVNNDGLLDIFTADMVAEDNKRLKTNMSGMNPQKFWTLVDSGYHHQYMFNALQLNRGQGHFSEIAQLSGISATDWSWSTLFSDLDQDGDKDLIITNGLKRDVRDNDFNIQRRKKVRELEAEAQSQGKNGISINPLELLALSPSTPIGNYFFENLGDLTFAKSMEEWGVDQKMISQGAALADLDRDGDLDIVFNNMDEAASIYENKRESYLDHHWIGIELDTPQPIGTVVQIETNQGIQVLECRPVTGYMSTSSSRLIFGLGASESISKMSIRWPDGEQEMWTDLEVDRYMTLRPGDGESAPSTRAESTGLFTEVEGIDFRHEENTFDDFETEILLPHRMSTIGPCMCNGDVNGDGLEDVFIGGAQGQPGELYLQDGMGGFHPGIPLGDVKYEDTGCAIFDADRDGWKDLYVVSGGNEERQDLSVYQDRLYRNQGSGSLKREVAALPEIHTSGKSIAVADFDQDGDLDIFIGGRQIPGKYPYPPDSHLLINEGGVFKDRTSEIAPELLSLGMVTDALWHDRDGDGDEDLSLVGEWMPITFFENQNGRLTESGLVPNSVGWWNALESMDIDGDGDEDLILGNLGLNIKYKASSEEPFQIFSADFDENGSNDIYMAYYQEGNCFPVRGRQCSSQQLPFVKKKFPTYNEFSEATVYEVLGEDTAGALNYQAEIFESIYLINEGDGYRMEALPVEAQFSVVNSIIVQDLDGDGHEDIYLAGNHFDREVETTRSDASYGVFLGSDGSGNFVSRPLTELGIYAGFDVREVLWVEGKEKDLLIIASNDDQVRTFAENQVSE
ncbi:MAG: VCBS repeat-containing protein, partial [Flavobacteriales bacterium]|nr:VCBS repeat-containing protein [Flavobacteriales bacterium]